MKLLVNLFYTVEFVYSGCVCNINSPITLHFVRSRWDLLQHFNSSKLVNQLKTPSLPQKILVNIWTNPGWPNGAWNLCQIGFIVTLLVNCLDKELIAYKTLSKHFMQVLSSPTQTATRVGPNYTLHSQN